jgi:hypothetical protein
MPLYRGDMLLVNGKIYALDSEGTFQQIYGPKSESETRPGVGSEDNDDGHKDTCIDLAFQHLNLDLSRLQGDRHPMGIHWRLVEDYLSDLPEENFVGSVGDFVREHPTGKFFVTVWPAEAAVIHTFALVDGVAHNIRWDCISGVCRAWRISDSTDTVEATTVVGPATEQIARAKAEAL